MSAFDELTLGEVEEMTKACLGGKNIGSDDMDPLMLAGGVMWIMSRRNGGANVSWDEFKANTRMGDIKAFSAEMESDTEDPTKSLSVPQT